MPCQKITAALCDRRGGFWVWAAYVLVFGLPGSAAAQFAVPVEVVDAVAEEATPGTGFDFGIDESLQAVVEDFERFARRGLWEKAIEALEKVDRTKLDNALLASTDGTVMPAGEQLWRLQAGLSGDFREAFRIFLNAKAKRVFTEAMAEGVKPGERDAQLEQIFRTYFVSSVGDEATNLLGDRAFREGKFDEAIRYWQSVLDYHPDSEIPEQRLLFKIGLAASQSGDHGRYDDSVRVLESRFADAMTSVGGVEVNALSKLKEFAPSDESGATGDGGTAERSDLRVPETLDIAWRHHLIDDKQFASMSINQNSYYRYKGMNSWITPTAVAGDRLAYNFFGVNSCVDLETGKLLWRQGEIQQTLDQLTGNIYQFSVDMYGVGAGGDLVISRFIPPDEMNYYRAGVDLAAYSLANGDKKWDVDLEKRGQSEWFHVGMPFVESKTVGEKTETVAYVVAIKSSGSDPHLRIHRGSGNAADTIRLGRYRDIDVSDYNDKRIPIPQFLGWSDDGYLLLMVDEGAVLALDLEAKKVAWGFRYDAPTVARTYNAITSATMLHPRSSAHRADNVLFLKDARRTTLVSFDLRKRRPMWTRQITATCEVVAHDERLVFVLGEELLALNREDGSLVWAAKLPMQNSGLSAEIVGDSIVVFTGRGLYELNRHDGSVVQIHREVDAESNGGRVLRHGDKLITVSERAISAWQLESYSAGEQADQ